MHIRHGDILLTKVETLPNGNAVEHNGSHVLALGEVTGHSHRLTVKDKESMSVIMDGLTKYIQLTVSAPLTHEEHKQVEVPAGIYRMTFEREYDYAQEEITQVQD